MFRASLFAPVANRVCVVNSCNNLQIIHSGQSAANEVRYDRDGSHNNNKSQYFIIPVKPCCLRISPEPARKSYQPVRAS